MKKRKSTRRRALKSSQRTSSTHDSLSRDPLESDCVHDFSTLPESVLICVLLKLGIEDISKCCCLSTTFARIIKDGEFWSLFCRSKWGAKTELESWLRRRTNQNLSIPNLPRPSTFKDLGYLLSRLDGLLGVWQGSLHDDSLKKELFVFTWGSDSLHFRKLGDFDDSDCLCIGPQYHLTAEVVDGCHCILKDYTKSLDHYNDRCSIEAIAAASVAVGPLAGLYLTEDVSMINFSTQMQEFFQSNVYCKTKAKSRRRGQMRLVPEIFHFTRVEIPVKTQDRWLAGIWMSLDSTDSADYLKIDYPLSGGSSILVEFLNGVVLSTGDVLWRFIADDKTTGIEKSDRSLTIEGFAVLEEGERKVECSMEIIFENCISFNSEIIDIFGNGMSRYKRIAVNEE